MPFVYKAWKDLFKKLGGLWREKERGRGEIEGKEVRRREEGELIVRRVHSKICSQCNVTLVW